METKVSKSVCSINHEDPFEWIESMNGVCFINSNIYLYSLHHNMLQLTMSGYKCLACMCDMANTKLSIAHTNTEEHKRALSMVRPIGKYGDDIVRPVGDSFHCGICNKVLTEAELNVHLAEDKIHKDRKVFAKNCASTITIESACTCVRAEHKDELLGKENDNDPFEMTTTAEGDVYYGSSDIYLNWYHYNTLQVNLQGWYRCVACATSNIGDVEMCPGHTKSPQHVRLLGQMKPIEEYGDDIIRQAGDEFHCGICNKVFPEEELKEHLADNEVHKRMKRFAKHCAGAHKAKGVPIEAKKESDFVKVTMKDKHALVRKNTYNSVVLFNKNFFCLICETGGGLDKYQAHLRTLGHAANMKNYPFLEDHGFHLIRLINEDYLICGACNIFVEAPHLRSHLIKKKHVRSIAAIKNENMEFNNEISFETVIDIRPIKEYYNNPLRWLHPKDRCAANAIMKLDDLGRWECLACDQVCLLETELEDHMSKEEHIQNLENAELIEGYNRLHIRKFGKWIHCSLCNEKVETMFRLFCHCLWDEHVNLLDTYIEENKQRHSKTGRLDALRYYYTMKVNRKKINEFYALNCLGNSGPKFDAYCNLCEVLLEGKKANHVYSERHVEKLERCAPLTCFGDNFIRVINNKNLLHCYYCNVVFDHDQIYNHIDSASHLCRKINNVETSRTYFLTNAMKAEVDEEFWSQSLENNENQIVYEFVYGTAKHTGVFIFQGNKKQIQRLRELKERNDALAAAENCDVQSENAGEFCLVESSNVPHDDCLKEESIRHSDSSEYIYVTSSEDKVQEETSDTEFSAVVCGVASNLNDYESVGCATVSEALPMADSSEADSQDNRTNGDNSVSVEEISMIKDTHERDTKQKMCNDAVSSTDNRSDVKVQYKHTHNKSLNDSDSGVDSSIDLHLNTKAVVAFRDITHLKMFLTGEEHVTSSVNGIERRITKSDLQGIHVDRESRNNIPSIDDGSAKSERIVEPDSCVTDIESDSSFEKLDNESCNKIPSFDDDSAKCEQNVELDCHVTDQESDSSFEKLNNESCNNIPSFDDDTAKSEHNVEPDSCVTDQESDCSFEKLNKDNISVGSENGSLLNDSFVSTLDDNKVVSEEDNEIMSTFERIFISNMKNNIVFVDSQGNASNTHDDEIESHIQESEAKEESKDATVCTENNIVTLGWRDNDSNNISSEQITVSSTQGSEIQQEKKNSSPVDNAVQENESKEETKNVIVLDYQENTTKDNNDIYEDAICHLQTNNVTACADDENKSNMQHNKAEEVICTSSEDNVIPLEGRDNDEEKNINMQGNETNNTVHSTNDYEAENVSADIKVDEIKYKTCSICKIDINEKYYGLHGQSVKHKLMTNIVVSVINTLTTDLLNQICIPSMGFYNYKEVNDSKTEFYCDKCNVAIEVSEVPSHMSSESHRLSELDEKKCTELNDYLDMGTSLTKTCCYSEEKLTRIETFETDKNTVLKIVVDVAPRKALLDVEAYNCVKRINGEYACYVCKSTVVNVEKHLASEKHVELLKQYPLDGPTLVRELDDSMDHCAVCNMIFLTVDREDHIITLEHDAAVTKAMYTEQRNLDAACKFMNHQLQRKHKFAIKNMYECHVCQCFIVMNSRAEHQQGRKHKAALRRQNKVRYTAYDNNYTYNKRKNKATIEMVNYINEYDDPLEDEYSSEYIASYY